MERLITYILILFAFLGVWQSCIDDDSTGFVRDLSMINIQSVQDTFYVNFGEVSTISAEITQTGNGNLTYEWGWGAVDDGGTLRDSLRVISTEPVLHYAFKKMGQFKVRLRVTNEDGSSFYYFELYVRSPFQEGVLVLSEDENKLGRTSFLRVKNPDEVVTGEGEFNLHAFEGVNPEIVLDNPQDVTWLDYMMVLTDGGKVIHLYDKLTFDYMNTIKVDQEIPGLKLKKICLPNPPTGFFQSLAWGMDGNSYIVDYDMMYVLTDTRYSPGDRYDKLYFQGSAANGLYVNFDESYINHALGGMWPSPKFTSGDYFKGRRIVNLMVDEGNQLHVVTIDPNDEQSVTITSFTNMNAMVGWLQFSGAFLNPEDYSYHADQPLTLTREVEMLTNNAYTVTFYSRGKELYQWIYKGKKLPEAPLVTLDGEITCMCLSPDNKYLYIGVWNPSAKETLKGSVYILDVKTNKIIRQYRGVADKPMKIMYKKAND